MKTTLNKLLIGGALIAMSGTLLVSCETDEIKDKGNEQTNLHTYQLIANVETTPNNDTRALSEDANQVINSAWTQDDKLMAYRLQDGERSRQANYSLLTSKIAGKTSPFDGTFTTTSNIRATDDLCFFYPGVASTGNDRTIAPAKETTETVKVGVTYKHYAVQDKIMPYVQLNLTEQDGTAKTIGERFDYQWAKVKPTSVNGTTVKANIGTMQRKIAIWAMRFADPNGNILTNIDSLYISNVKSRAILNLGTGEFITSNPRDETMNIVVKATDGGKISSANGKYTYIAALPGNFKDVLIMAYVGNNCYVRTYAQVNMEADKVYRKDVLMKNPDDKPYVDVQGTKWAKGNFIHYADENGNEYWGIAPTQWWISQRYIYNPVTGKMNTSQFVDDIKSIYNDLDLFRYGDISKVNILDEPHYMNGTGLDVSKKFFSSYGDVVFGTIPKTVSRDKATYGDIVYYYTYYNHKKYRMPTYDEFKNLFQHANCISAFCYSDNGLPIYGAYFYTCPTGSTPFRTFPERDLANYTNVSALVRAGKGLFLPVAGRRIVRVATIGQRQFSKDQNAYGQYMSSLSKATGMNYDFFFGRNEWNDQSWNYKAQAKSIRPVLDSDDGQDDPKFAAFANIH